MTTKTQYDPSSGSIPAETLLIYRPDRRHEIWRFVTYMVLHANWFHLGFNIVVQLIIGLPLEMVHGSIRIAAIYVAGVFAGSLGTSVVEPLTSLVGASGGVYALLAAHFANVLLNFNYMKYGILKLASILIFGEYVVAQILNKSLASKCLKKVKVLYMILLGIEYLLRWNF